MKRLKKQLAVLLATICLVVPIYGEQIDSILSGGTTLIPLRLVGESLGAEVGFEKATQTVTLSQGADFIVLKLGSNVATVNGKTTNLVAPALEVEGTVYVPVRFVGESLGGTVNYKDNQLSISLKEVTKEWTLRPKVITQAKPAVSGESLKLQTKTVNGRSVKYVMVDMKDPKVKVSIQTAGGKINQAADLKQLGGNGILAVNGTYFAAYNGATPYPDGVLVKDGKPLHITDIGCTVGFTSDNEVLIDFVTTRVQGYLNGEPHWTSYRMNRSTGDASATVIYTPEYGTSVTLATHRVGVVCEDGRVTKKLTGKVSIPSNGFVLVMNSGRASSFVQGDQVSYEVTFSPKNTQADQWTHVTQALSAGPSLLIGGKATALPKEEGFTEAKILTQVASRSFIGTTTDGKVIVGTTSATINELKDIAKNLGLVNAMCLDGGASSGLYYKGSYVTRPGRKINNSIVFEY